MKMRQRMLLPMSKCLDCGKQMDAASGLQGDPEPRPNDVSVCLYCGHITAFAEDLTLRPLTDVEMIEIAGNEDILRLQRLRAHAKRKGIPR